VRGIFAFAAVLLAASGVGIAPASQLTTKNARVVTSGPIFTNRAFSCSGLPPKGTRRGETVQLEAHLGPYKALVSGTVQTIALPYQFSLSRPTVTITYDGFTSNYGLLGPEPSTFFGLGYAAKAWRPGASYPQSALCLGWLGSKFEPTVVVPVFTGGTHCCTLLNFFGGPGGIVLGAVNLGNPAATISGVGNKAVLITGDNAFAYAFTDYAGSGMPIEVMQVSPTTESVVTVTRSWPSLVALDAKFWFSAFEQSIKQPPPHDLRGVLAAWAADECELGKCASAFAFLNHVKPIYLAFSDNKVPPSAYIRQLHLFLASHGYIRG